MVNAIGWWEAVAPGATWIVVLSIVAVTVSTMVLAYRQQLGPTSVGAVSAWLILAAASALFYDAGIPVVVFGMFVFLRNRPLWLIPVAIGATWSQPFARALGWSPLFIVVVGIWLYQIVLLFQRPDPVSQSPGTLAHPGGHDPDL
jgi:hypothetical protein